MALATYSDLLASVASWLNRDDLTAVIPDFVTLFERFANREIRTGAMEAETTLTAGASSPLIDLPADLAEIRWIVPTASPDATLKPISPQQGDTLYSIARAQLGNGNRWREIAKLNGIDGSSLRAGAELRMPQ